MTYSIDLDAPMQKALELYVANIYTNRTTEAFMAKTDAEKNQEAFEFLITSSLESVLRSEFDRQNLDKDMTQIADAIE